MRQLWQRVRNLFPYEGFYFDRPIVLFQSDDWGRVGVCDQQGWEQLRAAGISLGERPYDFYSLETAEDLGVVSGVLKRHRDSVGRHPCLEMNFVVANLDFAKMSEDPNGKIHMLPLADGLPQRWIRPSLLESYRAGIAEGLFSAALHGTTHFCRAAAENAYANNVESRRLLCTLWAASTPYIHWRMPWIGYEYWNPSESESRHFLSEDEQRHLVGQAVGGFAKLFSTLPHSACAPGFRASDETHSAWAQHGIQIAQNGPGTLFPPYFGRHEMLQLSRTVEFEPAVNPAFSLDKCLHQAEHCFQIGIPAIVSVHSINFHSTLRGFRSQTVAQLDRFLSALESRHPDLLYLHDSDLHHSIVNGRHRTESGDISIAVKKKKFLKRGLTLTENG